MEDQPRPSTSNTRLEPSRVRDMLVKLTTIPLISETLGAIYMEPTVPGTNSSNSKKVNSSSINMVNILMLTLRMLKENTQPQLQRTERFIKNGELSTLIKDPRKVPRV
jgi:hypothetical protein